MRPVHTLLCAGALLLAGAAAAQERAPVIRANPFAPVSWQPASPPPAAAPAVPPPTAPELQPAPAAPVPPPLPFRYLGRYSAGVPLVFLAKGDHTLMARAGDTLDGGWRVDSIAGAAIQFTFVPLQMKQSLATGDLP